MKKLSIGSIVTILILLSLALFAGAIISVFQTSMPAMLEKSEERYLTEQVDIVKGLLDDALNNAYRIADDIALWDATAAFIEGDNPTFIEDTWVDSSLLEAYRFNFILIKDRSGNDKYVEFYDFVNNVELAAPAGFPTTLTPLANSVVQKHDQHSLSFDSDNIADWGRGGIYYYQHQTFIVASMPVKETRSGETYGSVTMGIYLDDTYFKNLTHLDTIKFEITPAGTVVDQDSMISRVSAENVMASITLMDINDNPLLLSMQNERVIYTEGQERAQQILFWLLGSVVLVGLILHLLVRYAVINPLAGLSRDIGKMDETDATLNARDYSNSTEFHVLCDSINDMVASLNQSRVSLSVLQHILNGVDADLYVTDIETDAFLFMNDRMIEHFHIEDDPIGKTCWQIIQPHVQERCSFCPNNTLLENPDSIVIWEEHNDITGRDYRNTDCLIPWEDKMAHLQYRVDITETKQAEEELQRRLQQQQLMAGIARNFISTDDMETLVNNALRMAGEFLQVDRIVLSRVNEDLTQIAHTYFWLPEDSPFDESTFEPVTPIWPGNAWYDAFIVNMEENLTSSDVRSEQERGGFAHLAKLGVQSFISTPIICEEALWGILTVECFDKNHAWDETDTQLLNMISSIITALAERDNMEEMLIRMSSIANSSPQFISYTGPDAVFQYINPGTEALLGYSVDELKGQLVSYILAPETAELVVSDYIPRILQEGSLSFEIPVRHKDGHELIMSFSTFTTNQKNVGIGAIATNITERVRLEKELVLAKEEAERSNSAKSEFLSRMSHEMRTPMSAIIGMTNIAKGSDELERKVYCLDKIEDASHHLLGVINDILDMSKIEAQKFELSYTEFNFEKMLMRVIDVNNFRISEKNQDLVVEIDPIIPQFLVSDEQRLAQVITNYLSNASKFTPEGGTIRLTAKRVAEDNGLCTLEVTVSDTGIGISPEQQARLFQTFEQADGSISRKYGGSGLGLVISKNIVEMMSGEVWVESELGKGSTFGFRIKAMRGTTMHDARMSNVNWQTLRVLFVDDSPDLCDYFMTIAESLGFYCETATSGEEACQMIEQAQTPFNLVFVDWKMPGMNGVELTHLIKDRYGSDMVVIMVSAGEWADLKPEAQAAGVDDFIPKPLFASVIVDHINQKFGIEQVEEEAAAEPESLDLTGRHILLVEDVEINREIATTLLAETNLTIDCAENGKQAVEMFTRNPEDYDLILMDIHMPEMDGFEATRRIRALDDPYAREIPIVAMTANVFREDIENCLAAGMNDHIGKPIDLDELFSKLQHYIGPEAQ